MICRGVGFSKGPPFDLGRVLEVVGVFEVVGVQDDVVGVQGATPDEGEVDVGEVSTFPLGGVCIVMSGGAAVAAGFTGEEFGDSI